MNDMSILNALRAQYLDYGLQSSLAVWETAEHGEPLSALDNISFTDGWATENTIVIQPALLKQEMLGIGSSFTESAAFVLAHLEPSERQKVMQRIYSADGANFSIARTHIGACDFCVEGRYSYDDYTGDDDLRHFSIDYDKQGFPNSLYPDIKDPKFDLLPMIQEAMSIKSQQKDNELKIVASAWTAPKWMKDIDEWYIPGNESNHHQGTGGHLKPQHYDTYASYLNKYLDAYAAEGVEIWGLTPVNEPCGNNGQWESMHFTPETQSQFIKNHLGPMLKAKQPHIQLMMFDHNRNELEEWADVLYQDSETAQHLFGAAIHWYESSYKVAEPVLQRVHQKYPNFAIVHTEGCIDDLGKDAPEGILDPKGFKEENWFNNDWFWWNETASDWAYSATWPGVNAEDHPMYTPVHRYARNIIESINHWVSGWIDWNVVLDAQGGPNHVGNFCGAPIMIDTKTSQIYYTPVFYILSQLSRSIRPGDRAVQTNTANFFETDATIHATATINRAGLLSVNILNTGIKDVQTHVQIGKQSAPALITANSLQTIQVQLNDLISGNDSHEGNSAQQDVSSSNKNENRGL